MKKTDPGHYRVNEIFYSLQGEGFHTGTAAVFLRMSGCNRQCTFCDTDHASYRVLTADEIVREVMQHPARFIVITGGEPLLQLDKELIDALHHAGFSIAVETNGSIAPPEGIDWVTCSPKAQPWAIVECNEVKAVLHPSVDIEAISRHFKARHYFLQPCTDPHSGIANTAQTVEYILAHPEWRLSLQTHRILDIR
ncbi:MAG: 7-carboxy-7-deazaguanine synthase QueE [Muribaculaceae bacterium]|nr:7-carboxy-7-deazaguanine synthase QueE [Muribaculaceae bacterium]